MSYEVNLDNKSHYQGEKFAYLKTCYQERIRKENLEQKLEIAKIESGESMKLSKVEKKDKVKRVVKDKTVFISHASKDKEIIDASNASSQNFLLSIFSGAS